MPRLTALFALILCALTIAPNTAAAEWREYASKTGLFSVMMPHEPDDEHERFRISDDLVVNSGEMVANIDQRPYKNAVKIYRVSVDQTLGPEVSHDKKVKLINDAMDSYQTYYESLGGVLRDRKLSSFMGDIAGEIYISYEDPELGIQSMKARVVVTNSNKFQQSVTGPDSIMDNFETKQFWESLKIQKGQVYSTGSMNKEWQLYQSAFKMFSIKAPAISIPYFKDEPQIQSNDKREIMSLVYSDPIWRQDIFYNIYGYSVGATLKYADVSTILIKDHLKRHNRSIEGVNFKRGFIGDTPTIEAEYSVRSPKGYEYLDKVRLRAIFQGNFVVVQEVMTSQALMQSSFTRNFFDLIQFTPKKAFKALRK